MDGFVASGGADLSDRVSLKSSDSVSSDETLRPAKQAASSLDTCENKPPTIPRSVSPTWRAARLPHPRGWPADGPSVPPQPSIEPINASAQPNTVPDVEVGTSEHVERVAAPQDQPPLTNFFDAFPKDKKENGPPANDANNPDGNSGSNTETEDWDEAEMSAGSDGEMRRALRYDFKHGIQNRKSILSVPVANQLHSHFDTIIAPAFGNPYPINALRSSQSAFYKATSVPVKYFTRPIMMIITATPTSSQGSNHLSVSLMGEPSSVIYGIICCPPPPAPCGRFGDLGSSYSAFEGTYGYTDVLCYKHIGCQTYIFRLPVPPIKIHQSAVPLNFKGDRTNAKQPISCYDGAKYGHNNEDKFGYEPPRELDQRTLNYPEQCEALKYKLPSIMGELKEVDEALLVVLKVTHEGPPGGQKGNGSLTWNDIGYTALDLGHSGEGVDGEDNFEVVDIEYWEFEPVPPQFQKRNDENSKQSDETNAAGDDQENGKKGHKKEGSLEKIVAGTKRAAKKAIMSYCDAMSNYPDPYRRH